MYKLIRILNQNRKQILIAILAIVFVILTIQILNSVSKKNREERINNMKNEIANSKYNTSTYNPSQSIVSGGTISQETQSNVEEIVDKFINNCNNGQVEEAYQLLSTDCKEALYPTMEKFKQSYYAQNFKTKKLYSIQAWNSWPTIYKIEFYEDMLATGKVDMAASIQDFFTIVEEDGKNKLNISEYIGKETIEKKITEQGITIIANYKNIYKDYEVYNITIENATDNNILLNSGESTKTIYLEGENTTKYGANIYEISDSVMNLKSYYKATTNIKYNKQYLTSNNIQSIVFEDIILNADEYKETKDKLNYANRLKIQLDI